MFTNEVSEYKIYNLSSGKSVPEWLTDRRKHSLLKKRLKDRHINLIQDFDMPGVCTSLRVSPDQEYILATGTYKPRVKCYEFNNLSVKFERCFDSEIRSFEVISEDFSKIVFLQCDRYLEFHAAHGRHYRLRTPTTGLDIKYHYLSCDLFIVGNTDEIYRLNLERGQFLQPFLSEASCNNVCDVNTEHGILAVGSVDGKIETWDPRCRVRVATVDVKLNSNISKNLPSVTALKFKNGLHLGVGTACGNVLLYDIRSQNPLLIRDHFNEVPIKRIDFNQYQSTIYSMDECMLKIWDELSGKQVAYIESGSELNDFSTISGTGLFFIAQEDVQILTYYIPAIGSAPKWCGFLDNLIADIDSETVEHIYDDYQFVPEEKLKDLGLEHLIGTSLIKSYMHGYFIDAQLYKKAVMNVDVCAVDKFRKDRIRKEIENDRKPRLQIKAIGASVNKELALKIEQNFSQSKDPTEKTLNLLEDKRFKDLFQNVDFTIDQNTDEYKLLDSVLTRMERYKNSKKQRESIGPVVQLENQEEASQGETDDENLFRLENDLPTMNEGKPSSNTIEEGGSAKIKGSNDCFKQKKESKYAYKIFKRGRMFRNIARNIPDYGVEKRFNMSTDQIKMEDKVNSKNRTTIPKQVNLNIGNQQLNVYIKNNKYPPGIKRKFEANRKSLVRSTNCLSLKTLKKNKS